MSLSDKGIWNLGFLLLPVLVLQALYTRKKTRRLPEAAGDRQGLVSIGEGLEGEAFRIAVLGESTVAGVGVVHQQQALPAQLAGCLSETLKRDVHWHGFGGNGLRIGESLSLVSRMEEEGGADVVIVAFGVNDTKGLSSVKQWQCEIQSLIARLRQSHTGAIIFCAVPPIHYFSALPQPLRAILGARSRIMDSALADVCSQNPGVIHSVVEFSFDPEFLAVDGFHPSAKGVERWAHLLVEANRCAGVFKSME